MAVSGDKNGKLQTWNVTNTPTYKTWHMMNNDAIIQNAPKLLSI